ncbi:MAG: DUF1648 domain-containing protein [Anaerolineae bacterium]|nr:DUF1648 domain-containing protein [Anaerolineae bacterium]
MNWTPNRRKGALLGAGWILLLVVIDSLLLWRVINGKLNGWTFICALLTLASLPAMALIGYWIYGLMRLRYEFDRNRLVITTASGKQIIPMSNVKRVLDGRNTQGRLKSLTWPGYWIGHGTIEGIGLALFYGVDPPQAQAIVVTPSLAYGISVPDMDTFLEVFHAALSLGPNVQIDQQSEKAPYVNWAIWQDRLTQTILALGLAINVLLFGILTFAYPTLPTRLPLHFDASGAVDRIAPQSDVFALPIIGLIVWSLNGLIGAVLYRRQRMASYLVWSGGIVVQVFLFLAMWNIVN